MKSKILFATPVNSYTVTTTTVQSDDSVAKYFSGSNYFTTTCSRGKVGANSFHVIELSCNAMISKNVFFGAPVLFIRHFVLSSQKHAVIGNLFLEGIVDVLQEDNKEYLQMLGSQG